MNSTWSFRPLLLFWAIVAILLLGGAAWLQWMGPLPPAAGLSPPPAKHEAPPVASSGAVPAHIGPSAGDPAPALAMISAAIPDPDPALLEPAPGSTSRLMPRVAAPDRTAARLYAAAFDPAERHPRVALVIDGAGLDRALTAQAIATLPSAIDLAFSAYAPPATAAELAGLARRQGRECLVSIPMEPSGFPAADEGDHALLVGADAAEITRNLDWDLSAVAGCVGATGGSDGLAGERFAQSSQAFADMLAELDRRGLIYLDPRPGRPASLEPPGRTPPRRVDIVIDSAAIPGEPADAQAIDRNLAELEGDAARHGSAIGLAGPPRPVLLDRIAIWAHGLAARGLVLAPLTAIPPPHPTEAAP